MKIASWETFVVGNPPPSEGGNYFIFVKLVTDDGIVGLGEASGAGAATSATASVTSRPSGPT